jgi:2-methylcitrate dehydratase PrpD
MNNKESFKEEISMGTYVSVMARLTGYIAQVQSAELPLPVLEKAKHHILDTLAAMVSGSQLKPGRLAIAYAKQQGGPPEAQVVASRIRVSAVNAALANGMLAHSDETDDSHSTGGIHPGCAIVPAALAMAERENASGKDFLRAVVLGYDVGCRTTKALGGRMALRARNHLPFSISGTMGCTAAAGSLAGLKSDQFPHLFSYGAQQASGVMTYARDTEHIEKAFIFGGMPARNGVTAAIMVQNGFTGLTDVFSGDGNFLIAYSETPRPEELAAELGSRYEVMGSSIKKYCVGFPIQLPLEALTLIMQEHRIRAQDVEQVVAHLEGGGAHTVNNREMPDINLQHIFAITLLDGDLSFEAAHSFERMRDPRVLEVKARISLVAEPEVERVPPQRHSIVEVNTKDGRSLRKRVTTFRGNEDNPLSKEGVEKKASDLLEPMLGAQRSSRLIDAVGRLETLESIRDLVPLLEA